MRSRRSGAVPLLAALSLVGVGDVAAQPLAPPSEERCLQAYEQGQRLRLKHALLEARAELLLCAQAACPATFRPECVQWFDEVQRLVPSVIIHVRGDAAATSVRVLIDGVLVASTLDGTPIQVDPGQHTFRFEPKGGAASEQPVLINEGQQERVLTITVVAPVPARNRTDDVVAPRSPTSSITPWVFAGVSGLALGSFAYFGATGLSRRNRLDTCNPYCPQADLDSTRLRFDLADASLAVSAVSLGIAIYAWLSASRSGSSTSAGAVHLEASGGPSTAFVGVSGGF